MIWTSLDLYLLSWRTIGHVTWLNSRSSLAACDWLLSALSVKLSTRVRCRRKFGEDSCTECTGQRNDFELIPTAKMETRLPLQGSLGNKFPSICRPNHCEIMAAWSRKRLGKKFKFLRYCRKTTLYGANFKILFRKDSSRHRSTVQISWNLADGKLIKSCAT